MNHPVKCSQHPSARLNYSMTLLWCTYTPSQTFRYLHGLYEAVSAPELDLDPTYLRRQASATPGSPFPAQVRSLEPDRECSALAYQNTAQSILLTAMQALHKRITHYSQIRFKTVHNFQPLDERKFCHLVQYHEGTNVFRHRLCQADTIRLIRLLARPETAPNNEHLPYETNGYVRIPEKAGFLELRRKIYGK